MIYSFRQRRNCFFRIVKFWPPSVQNFRFLDKRFMSSSVIRVRTCLHPAVWSFGMKRTRPVMQGNFWNRSIGFSASDCYPAERKGNHSRLWELLDVEKTTWKRSRGHDRVQQLSVCIAKGRRTFAWLLSDVWILSKACIECIDPWRGLSDGQK